jgi:SecD/SecF fusion protein
MTKRRSHLILVALILAALAGVAALGIPGSPVHKKVTLGLDLQGGLEVVLKAEPSKGQKLDSSALDRSVSIMRQRVDKLGVSEPEIRKQGSNQIVIELAGVHDPAKAAAIIGKTAQLELYDLETSVTGPSLSTSGNPQESTSLFALLSASQSLAKSGEPAAYYAFGKNKVKSVGPVDTRAGALKQAKQANLKPPFKVLAVPQNTVVVTCDSTEVVCPGNQPQQGNSIPPPPKGQSYYYLFIHNPDLKKVGDVKGVPELTGSDLKLSGTRQDFDPTTNEPVVLMQFTGDGSHKFQAVTSEEYNRGHNRNGIPQHFAIVLDREIRSFPQIDPTKSDLAGGISGNAEISGIGSIGEAKDLALVLQTGALPVNFVPVERTDVSATLGKDSLNEAKKAALIGLLLVAVFLLVLYRFLGLVAVIGLAIYAAFLYAAILLFHVTMTLPGFAGLILTIGVAADANVVVFERIKEEVRAGKSVRAAISAGYGKGFHTIIDANVVTLITALVLFAVATAGVKGFALVLIIGTVISLITAVAATRAMLGLLSGFSWFDNPRFMGAAGQQSAKWLQIDFMRRRYLWFAISGVIIVVGAASLGTKGLNLGIDFKGGTQVTFKTAKPVSLTDVRNQAKLIGQSDAVIQGRGKTFGSDSYQNFQMRMKSLSGANQNKLSEDLKSRYGQNQKLSLQITNVSSSFGRQIARSAIIAIIVSLLLIVLYITVRFDLKFAGPVIAALLHDIVITVGVYSLTGREVSNSTVAAVLTVLGYSIYDTIIIFDRIRENIPLMRRSSFATIANVSLWETIRRSLATTFITLLPIVALLIFGGATLKDFAFALIVGITSGAYSSIFIAAPLLTILKEREPEFARRKGIDEPEGPEPDGGTPARRRPRLPWGGGAPAADPGTVVLEEAEQAAAAEPSPSLEELVPSPSASAEAKRERRRQRRRARPHGRAR